MNKKYWMTGLLALLLAFSAGCGQKPTAAPAETNPETATGEVQTPQDNPGETAADDHKEDDATSVNAGEGASTPPQNTTGQSTGTPVDTKDVNATEDQAKKANIKLYYTDPEIMDLKEASKEITYSGEEDKYKKAFEGLQTSSDAALSPLWSDKITLKSLKFDKGALTLDITKPAEANLGAGGEMFAIDALQKTFFQFDEVQSLELLVDGKQIESLMGHVELEHPMTRK
ncbi:GerMN domain-containing protein [Paenibacillus lautus]|uniref:GerMN domain-containing protein n=1 Tax=Paenibacillus TaxID=44249 RepID=UPI001BE56A06|nr:GerMN domain-containing protein [Paenibacillus sp. ISL-20]MBT2760656.1 GerMN domain-containing protein [Paenibacillus sp. ISL-20]